MDLKKIYAKSDDIVSRKIGEETILVPINRQVGELDNVYALNETAAFIWDQIDGKRPLQEIKECMIDEYEIGSELADKDLSNCVAQFEEMQGIKEVD